MVFECQTFPYKKEFTSNVVSCVPATIEQVLQGKKKEKIQCFEVILEDTILFPEGGGQPDDRGTLNDVAVLQVKRKGKDALHYVAEALEVGKPAVGKIDWPRRWDHMQQHSGQHLITAIADAMFGFKTTSWWLGELISHIELDTPSMSDDQMLQIENAVNEKIREAVSVEVKVYEEGDKTLREVRTRGLPEDHHGAVRVVTMMGIDSNMCCGTHVSNLSHLQAVKLVQFEKAKKNKTNLFFLSGTRLLDHLSRCLARERQLTTILKNGPDDHIDLINKLQNTVKTVNKTVQTLMRELGTVEAEKIKADNAKYCVVHRKDGDNDFLNVLLSELSLSETTLLVTIGEDNSGQMALVGSSDVVQQLGPRICEIFAGKGAAKGKRFQAKVSQLNSSARLEAEAVLRDYYTKEM